MLNEQSVPITVVMELVGHSRISTTECYLKSNDDLKVEAVKALKL